MKRGYSELVGVQATMSRILPRYSLIHYYRWKVNGETKRQGTLRGYDMHRHLPVGEVLRSLRDAYHPATLAIWRQVTKACVREYLQFGVGATPLEMKFDGVWRHGANP